MSTDHILLYCISLQSSCIHPVSWHEVCVVWNGTDCNTIVKAFSEDRATEIYSYCINIPSHDVTQTQAKSPINFHCHKDRAGTTPGQSTVHTLSPELVNLTYSTCVFGWIINLLNLTPPLSKHPCDLWTPPLSKHPCDLGKSVGQGNGQATTHSDTHHPQII